MSRENHSGYTRKEYVRAYNAAVGQPAARARRKAFKAAWLAEHGPCAHCGSPDQLEADHIDPATKDPRLASKQRKMWSSFSLLDLIHELTKCQVLCHPCHLLKSAQQQRARRGFRHLTNEEVRQIRTLATSVTYPQLAEMYTRSIGSISAIVNNKAYVDPNYVPPVRIREPPPPFTRQYTYHNTPR